MRVYTVALQERCAQGLAGIVIQTQCIAVCCVCGGPTVPVRMFKALINMAGHANVAFIAANTISLGPLNPLLAVAVSPLAAGSVAPRRFQS